MLQNGGSPFSYSVENQNVSGELWRKDFFRCDIEYSCWHVESIFLLIPKQNIGRNRSLILNWFKRLIPTDIKRL